jgi:transposase
VDTKASPSRKKRRPNYSPEFRRKLAQRACEPGVSVSQLAQENDVNVNMLFKWRRYLLAGKFDVAPIQQAMLPVTVIEAPANDEAQPGKTSTIHEASPASDTTVAQRGIIEVVLADATVRINGHADLSAVHAIMRMLRP